VEVTRTWLARGSGHEKLPLGAARPNSPRRAAGRLRGQRADSARMRAPADTAGLARVTITITSQAGDVGLLRRSSRRPSHQRVRPGHRLDAACVWTFIKLVHTSTSLVDLDWRVRLTAGDDMEQMPAADGVIGSARG
jgi:hypothetical protein